MHDIFDTPRARTVEPGEYPAWDEALALVNHDLNALLPDQGPMCLLALPAWPEESADDEQATEHVYVALPDGRWHGNDLPPDTQAPGAAIADVAEAAQETVLGCLWQVWPVCAEHRLGMHAGWEDGHAVWRCAGGNDGREPGHVQAPVGKLEESYRSRGERRRQRKENKQGTRNQRG
ncbi:hypothetical protein J2X68_004551 [Streptomyces sp. 3330]|uniref:hypothetical protein n=1 Tax=Streptomyces sp. 3330 TaxID=2817755 RepID=UPI0028559FD0|nr:hypothetical protein [Streptomyces sp. 3330]MDR6977827.1 hypothetical protein [Streptomyces sp. 3330]